MDISFRGGLEEEEAKVDLVAAVMVVEVIHFEVSFECSLDLDRQEDRSW